MKRLSALVLSILMLLSGCKTTDDENAANYVESALLFPSPTIVDNSKAFPESSAEDLFKAAKAVFGDYLTSENSAENIKIKLFFNDEGKCEVPENGTIPEKLISDFIDRVNLTSNYIEICLDSRFSDGIGISAVKTDSPLKIPDKMPNSYNFADGFFDGSLSDIKTYPVLQQGVSLAEYEYENMEDCINQLNEYAKAAALTAKQAGLNKSWFNAEYTKMYGTAQTALCSDKNGKWSIYGDYKDKILVDAYEEKIVSAFNKSETLSKAANCTIRLMFYMEEFVGVSAAFSPDKKFFSTEDVAFGLGYTVPSEEDFSHKSFLYWYGIDGCLKSESGRLCPIGTYCTETGAPLGVYMPISMMGDWKAVSVGGVPFDIYAKENSNKYNDWRNLIFRISEDALFLYGKTISTSRYDIIVSDGKYLIKYNTNMDKDWGRIIVNDDGTLTLYMYHYFVNYDTSVPIILERYTPDNENR